MLFIFISDLKATRITPKMHNSEWVCITGNKIWPTPTQSEEFTTTVHTEPEAWNAFCFYSYFSFSPYLLRRKMLCIKSQIHIPLLLKDLNIFVAFNSRSRSGSSRLLDVGSSVLSSHGGSDYSWAAQKPYKARSERFSLISACAAVRLTRETDAQFSHITIPALQLLYCPLNTGQ